MKNYSKMGAILALLFVVSCGGRNNVTGKDSKNNDFLTGGVYSNSGTSNLIAQVMGQNPCMLGGQREVVQVQINLQVDPSSLYIGMTSEGDVSSVQASQNGALMTMHICTRPGTNQGSGQGQLMGNPILGYSQVCPFDDIKAADVALPGPNGYFYLSFRPVAIAGAINNAPNICSGNGFY